MNYWIGGARTILVSVFLILVSSPVSAVVTHNSGWAISDHRGCEGVSQVRNGDSFNSLSVILQPQQHAIITVKINCLSSEFAAKKHGLFFSCLDLTLTTNN